MIAPGTRLGPYVITASIGAGGMGEVYRATDTRLDRTVAVKVLPEHVAADPDLKQRFEREAKTLAALSHPHICPMFDVGSQNGTDFLVMEYLEGETLEQRLKKGALPLDQALQIAIQIADALAAAHRAGIIHRDLKPGNVMVTKSGAKLLDFGLAKTGAPVVAGSLSMLPTTPPNLTAQGTILGTFQYMAPEQLEGHEADARTDIWAFGAVLYEMLTGRRAFEGKSQASLVAAILKDTPPPVSRVRPMLLVALDPVIQMCLTKDPNQRWQSTHDLNANLRWLSLAPTPVPLTSGSTGGWREWVAWGLAAAVGLAWLFSVLLPFRLSEPVPGSRVIRATIDAPPGTAFVLSGGNSGTVQVSPDGNQLVFLVQGASARLWLRALDSAEARPLPGTDGAGSPFWSADGKYVAFSSGQRLMKIDVTTGVSESICEVSGPLRGGSWSRDNDILFSVSDDRRLYRVRAEGGTPTPLADADGAAPSIGDVYPQFLPDGRHFLFLRKSIDLKRQGIYVGSLDSNDVRFIANSRWNATYAGGRLLYLAADSSALIAQNFDLERFALVGAPQRMLDQVGVSGPGLTDSRAQFSASEGGVLAYHSSVVSATRMTWLDRTGSAVGTLGPPGFYANPVMSPDGSQLAIDRWEPQRAETHIWLFDLVRATGVPLRAGSGSDASPAWSADGREVAFVGAFEGTIALYRRNVSTGVTERLAPLQRVAFPTAWSRDGTLILTHLSSDLDIHALASHDSTSKAVAAGPGPQASGAVSPDGRWLAYMSTESGRQEVYVQPLSAPGSKVVVSTAGGSSPLWGGDGRDLFFLDMGRRVLNMATVQGVKDGRILTDVPRPVLPLTSPAPTGLAFSNPFQRDYAVAKDGNRFLRLVPVEEREDHQMTVVVNWPALLKQ